MIKKFHARAFSVDFSSFGMTKSELSEGRRETEKQRLRREAEERNVEVQKKPELNPDLRGDRATQSPNNSAGNSQARRIGDGGAAWLRRAFKRAEEQAAAEGKSIEEVAAARWGSLDKFKEMLAKAEGRSGHREEV